MTKTRVLVADDHEVVRKGVVRILHPHAEFEVVSEVDTGVEAVAETQRLHPELVVMDIMLPGLNGLEATKEIRKTVPATGVLILSMYHSEQMVREVLMCGARGYVLKSDAARDLVQGLKAISQGQPFFAASVTESVLEDFRKAALAKPRDIGEVGRLSAREREVVQLLAEGNTNKEIAAKLSIGVSTVESHRAHVMHKLRLDSMGALVRYAIRNRLVDC